MNYFSKLKQKHQGRSWWKLAIAIIIMVLMLIITVPFMVFGLLEDIVNIVFNVLYKQTEKVHKWAMTRKTV